MQTKPRKQTIMILDGDRVARAELAYHLKQEGYAVIEAETSYNLSAQVKSEQIDLVLLDINLPGKDGLALTRELRVESNVGIILVTSRDDAIDRIVGLELGADDYIVKPYNPRELLVRSKNQS